MDNLSPTGIYEGLMIDTNMSTRFWNGLLGQHTLCSREILICKLVKKSKISNLSFPDKIRF